MIVSEEIVPPAKLEIAGIVPEKGLEAPGAPISNFTV
jgi:hypothetical protein